MIARMLCATPDRLIVAKGLLCVELESKAGAEQVAES
jgi:hypothetical protein